MIKNVVRHFPFFEISFTYRHAVDSCTHSVNWRNKDSFVLPNSKKSSTRTHRFTLGKKQYSAMPVSIRDGGNLNFEDPTRSPSIPHRISIFIQRQGKHEIIYLDLNLHQKPIYVAFFL